MLSVHLTDEQRDELDRRTRTPGIKPRTRDRLEMVRLAGAGWQAQQIATHFRRSVRRVRFWLNRFRKLGFDGLEDQPHVGKISRLTPEMIEALREVLDQGERTWTRRQVAEWLENQYGLRFSLSHLGALLRRVRLSSRRTERDLGHKQDPKQVAACKADLQTLEKGEKPGAWTSAT